MPGKLEGKIALITGGSSGIGLATGKRFLSEGAKLVIAGRRQEQIDAAVSELGADVLGVAADGSRLAALERLMGLIRAQHGRLDVVFANAGGSGGSGPRPLAQFDEELYESYFDQNVKSVLFTVQKSLELLSDGGSIVLTTSIANVKGMPGATAYGAAKAAVRSFARTWSNELKGRHIRVNAVSPGPIDTPLHKKAEESNPGFKQAIMGMVAAIPVGRIGDPADVAAAVTFLASADASFITGVELCVDGGLTQV